VPPSGPHRDPLNTLAGTLADPRDQAWGARVKPEIAALRLAQEPASHSLAAGGGLGEHRSCLAGRMTRGPGRGSTAVKDGPDLEDGLHADDNKRQLPMAACGRSKDGSVARAVGGVGGLPDA